MAAANVAASQAKPMAAGAVQCEENQWPGISHGVLIGGAGVSMKAGGDVAWKKKNAAAPAPLTCAAPRTWANLRKRRAAAPLRAAHSSPRAAPARRAANAHFALLLLPPHALAAGSSETNKTSATPETSSGNAGAGADGESAARASGENRRKYRASAKQTATACGGVKTAKGAHSVALALSSTAAALGGQAGASSEESSGSSGSEITNNEKREM